MKKENSLTIGWFAQSIISVRLGRFPSANGALIFDAIEQVQFSNKFFI